MLCGSANISASYYCMEGVCEYVYNISSSECYSSMKSDILLVSVWATNALGRGQPYSQDIGVLMIFLICRCMCMCVDLSAYITKAVYNNYLFVYIQSITIHLFQWR